MKILIPAGNEKNQTLIPVTVELEFVITVAGKDLRCVVHRCINRPSRFVAAEWQTGLKLTDQDHATPEFAKHAAIHQMRAVILKYGDVETLKRLEVQMFDRYINNPEGYIEDEL